MSKKALLLSAAVMGLAPQFMAAPALAQDQAADDQALQGAEVQGEIVITARKRNERLLDVPIAVSALNEDALERYSVNSLSAIGQQVPSLIIAESQNQVGGSINLRGVGAGVSNPSTEQSVTLNLDGIGVSYGNAVRLGQLDVQRVEVLKGPQALFYGKNSPGGILSLISKDPGDEFEAQVRAGYEFEAKQRFIEAIVSGPITETVGARVVGYYSKEDGWFRNNGVPVAGWTPGAFNDSLNNEDLFLRGTLTFNAPSDVFRLKAKVNYGTRERDGVGNSGFAQIRVCPFGVSQVSGRAIDCGLDRNFASVALRPAAAALHPSLGDGIPFAKSKQFLTSLSADYDVAEGVTLSSVTGYYKIHEDSFDSFTFVGVPRVSATNDVHIKSFSQEVRLASDLDGPFNFLVGGFYQKSQFTIAQVVPIDGGGNAACPSATCFLTPFTFYDQDTTAWSGFAQLRFAFTEQLELAAGARLSTETKSIEGTVNNTPFTILKPKNDYHDFSPEITLTYKPNSDLTIFAAYREGFTSGGYNTIPTAIRSPAFPTTPLRDLSFDQMTAKGGELGVKGYLMDRQIMFDLVGYYYKYKGLQLSRFDSIQVVQLTQNAGGAKVRGIELNTTFRPRAAPGLEVRSSVNYNKATYSDFIGACYPGQSIAAGCNLVLNGAGTAFTSQDQGGQQIARAPKWTMTGGFTYEHDFSGDIGGSISFDVAYTSSYMTQIEAQPEARQSGYWLLNGNLSIYGGDDRGWQVSLIGRNLTNKIVAISGGAVAFVGTGTGTNVTTPADLYGSVNLPRSILLQVTLKNTLFGGN